VFVSWPEKQRLSRLKLQPLHAAVANDKSAN
jgi:hypothetical protein